MLSINYQSNNNYYNFFFTLNLFIFSFLFPSLVQPKHSVCRDSGGNFDSFKRQTLFLEQFPKKDTGLVDSNWAQSLFVFVNLLSIGSPWVHSLQLLKNASKFWRILSPNSHVFTFIYLFFKKRIHSLAVWSCHGKAQNCRQKPVSTCIILIPLVFAWIMYINPLYIFGTQNYIKGHVCYIYSLICKLYIKL